MKMHTVYNFVCFTGRKEVINQTSFVDLSVVSITATTTSSTTFIPLLESSTVTVTTTSETVPEVEAESPDTPSMFSTSMAPPRPTPADQEEELFTTVAPTIKEENEDTDDVTTATPDFDVDYFVRENLTHVQSAPPRGDIFPEPESSTETTEAVSEPVEEPDDQSVIEISTVQPDVPIPDFSLSTEPMFAEGKTEKTILDSPNATEMTSDLTTESAELTIEEVFGSSESTPSPAGTHLTTPFTDYDSKMDEVVIDFTVEGLPPMQPTSSDSTSTIDGTTVPVTTTLQDFHSNEMKITTTASPQTTRTATQNTPHMQDVETPAVHKEESTFATVTANPVLIDSGTSAEDVTSPSSVHVFDESSTHVPEHSGDFLTEDDTATDIGTEFFTSAPMSSAVASRTMTPGTVVADEQSIQVTTAMQKENESGKTNQE